MVRVLADPASGPSEAPSRASPRIQPRPFFVAILPITNLSCLLVPMSVGTVDQTTSPPSLERVPVPLNCRLSPGLVAASLPLPLPTLPSCHLLSSVIRAGGLVDLQLPCEVLWSRTSVNLTPSCHLGFEPSTSSSKKPCRHPQDSSPPPGQLPTPRTAPHPQDGSPHPGQLPTPGSPSLCLLSFAFRAMSLREHIMDFCVSTSISPGLGHVCCRTKNTGLLLYVWVQPLQGQPGAH